MPEITGLDLLLALVFAALIIGALLWLRRDEALTPWKCRTCHARYASAEMLDAHLGTHRRPLMPGILCTCSHTARGHFCGDGPCADRDCECPGFTPARRAVA